MERSESHKRMGRHKSVDVIYGGGTGYDTFRLRFLSPVRINRENNGRSAKIVPAPNHKNSGVVDYRRYVGDTSDREILGSHKDAVGGHLYWTQTGHGDVVSGAALNIQIMHKG